MRIVGPKRASVHRKCENQRLLPVLNLFFRSTEDLFQKHFSDETQCFITNTLKQMLHRRETMLVLGVLFYQ